MVNIHVKANGDMGRCQAEKGGCPFTKEGAEHFDSFANAATYAEAVIAKLEGGSFAGGGLKKVSNPHQSLPEGVKDDPANYTKPWDTGLYMGSYIEEGDTFEMHGTLYRANSWDWNRALLVTDIEATNLETGEDEDIAIYQGSEGRISFFNDDAVYLHSGAKAEDHQRLCPPL